MSGSLIEDATNTIAQKDKPDHAANILSTPPTSLLGLQPLERLTSLVMKGYQP